MANIHFDCPKCAQHISAPDSVIGTQAECPTCKAQFNLSPMKSELGWEYEREDTSKQDRLKLQRAILNDADRLAKEAEEAHSTAIGLCALWIAVCIISVIVVASAAGPAFYALCGLIASILFVAAICKYFACHMLHIRAAIVRLGAKFPVDK